MLLSRREFMRISAVAGASLMTPGWARRSWADVLRTGLLDPELQPKFAYSVPNALDPAFLYQPDSRGRYNVSVSEGIHRTGLVDSAGKLLSTRIFGYGDQRWGPTWPGRTFQVMSARAGGLATTEVQWKNQLQSRAHLLPVDTSVH